MAHNNPRNETSSYASTREANAPLGTNSGYNTSNTTGTTGTTHANHGTTNTAGTTGTTGTTHTTHATTNTAGSTGTTGTTGTGRGVGSEIKSVFAGIHGTGEKIRGEFNSGVDRAFNEREGEAKNAAIAQEGDREMYTGEFSHETKNREGVVPGSNYERRL